MPTLSHLDSQSRRTGTCWEVRESQLELERLSGGPSHTWGLPWASPVQGLLLHDVFKHVLVFLPEAAKLIAGAELVSSGAGELDVEG